MFFFFSSRRRHTRFDCDWSSDVCSSDLLSASGNTSNRATSARAAIAVRRIVDPSWPWNTGAGLPDPPSPPSTADRKSTRLNSSHSQISYAVFCLKKKKNKKKIQQKQIIKNSII